MRLTGIKIALLMAVGSLLSAQETAPPASAARPQKALATLRNSLDDFSETIEKLVGLVDPAVVEITTESYGSAETESAGSTSVVINRKAVGSGVFVSADGDLITNSHVVTGARKVRVRLHEDARDTGKLVDAQVVGLDRESDLALLKVPGSGRAHLKFGDYALLHQGQLVFAVGNPRGLENSISMGVVSAVARQMSPDAAQAFIQTDAPINPGNSGGPLINARGEIVGINTFIVSESGGSEGLGFAIPSSL
ncbi:MAG TPA: trypsin-like peptidase domain-containing protein, partial [Bryobacteraceae bacterium]|nr:trypsin-like peptidase domain-containing protein [Bryobacteraceae bacterium]